MKSSSNKQTNPGSKNRSTMPEMPAPQAPSSFLAPPAPIINRQSSKSLSLSEGKKSLNASLDDIMNLQLGNTTLQKQPSNSTQQSMSQNNQNNQNSLEKKKKKSIAIVSTQMAYDPTTNQVICVNTLENGQISVTPATAQMIAQFQGQIPSNAAVQRRSTTTTSPNQLQRKPTQLIPGNVNRLSYEESADQPKRDYKPTTSNRNSDVPVPTPKKKDIEEDRKVDRMITLPNGETISPLDGGYKSQSALKKKSSLDDILNLPD